MPQQPSGSTNSLLGHLHFSSFNFVFKFDLGNCQEEFFVKPFPVFIFLVLAGFPLLSSKLSVEIIKRSFFSNPFRFFRFLFRYCFVLVMFHVFSSFVFNLTLNIVKRSFFLEPFSFFSFSFVLEYPQLAKPRCHIRLP